MHRYCWRTLPLSATDAERGTGEKGEALQRFRSKSPFAVHPIPLHAACSSCTTHAYRDELSRNISGSLRCSTICAAAGRPWVTAQEQFPGALLPCRFQRSRRTSSCGVCIHYEADSGAVDQPPELGVVDVIDDFAGHDHVDGLIDNAAAHYEPLSGVVVQAVLVNLGGVKPDLGEHAVK